MKIHEHLKRSLDKLHKKHEGGGEKTFTNKEGEKKKHVGFAKAQSDVEREGYSKKIAGAIIASRSRHASAGAKKANSRLANVKG
jgi:hypothetical protein